MFIQLSVKPKFDYIKLFIHLIPRLVPAFCLVERIFNYRKHMNSQYTKSGITEFMNPTKIHVCGTWVGLIQYKNKRVGLDFFPLGSTVSSVALVVLE